MIDSARAYHDGTSYNRHEMKGHFLDWGNQPNAFKVYSGFNTVPLPEGSHRPDYRLSDLVGEVWKSDQNTEINVNSLARILLLSHAVTATARHGGTDFHFRSVASAGALYPFELYVAVFDVPGVEDGIYHHDVANQGVTLLRAGNVLADLSPAVKLDKKLGPVLMFLLTAIFFRSSWKYRDRAYRYALLDTGHLAENLTLALRYERACFNICYDFDDKLINGALGLDTQREVCLAVVPVWGRPTRDGARVGISAPQVDLAQFSRVASREIEYPVIQQAHATTSRINKPDLGVSEMAAQLGLHLQEERTLSRPESWPDTVDYPEAVFRRRSMRNFVRTELSADRFSALLTMLCAKPLSSTGAEPVAEKSVCVGFLAGNVEGLASGLYMLHRDRETTSLVERGFMMDEMAHVCLDQGWLANCAIHFLFLANIDVLESSCGPRGYRYAMMTAGRLGQRIYLSATAMKLGCCGIGAYYDGEAARLLRLKDQSKLLYLVAVGPVKKYHG